MRKYGDGEIPDKYLSLENAKTVLIPVPYDETSTWGKGADRGPSAFLDATPNLEFYDIETDSEVYKEGVFVTESVIENSTPDAMVEAVYSCVKDYLGLNRFVTVIGGEHSVSIGAIRAVNERYNNLSVLHLDAHADLRAEYDGSPYNHACALHEAGKTTNLVQVGIRSMDSSEKEFMDFGRVYFAHKIMDNDLWMEKAVNQLIDNVYITIDLDVFDPSVMPSTGTPEPGGMNWYQTLRFLKIVFQKKNVVALDIVELAPNENNKSPDFLAAKLYYKLLTYKFAIK